MRAHSRLYLMMLLWALPFPLAAQDMPTSPHSSSTVSPSRKYEIIQSRLAARWTFRLDRMCGVATNWLKQTVATLLGKI